MHWTLASQLTADSDTPKYSLVIPGTTLKVNWNTLTAVRSNISKSSAIQAWGYVFNSNWIPGIIAAAAVVGAEGVDCKLVSSCCVLARLFLRKNRKNLSFEVVTPFLISILDIEYKILDDAKERSNQVDTWKFACIYIILKLKDKQMQSKFLNKVCWMFIYSVLTNVEDHNNGIDHLWAWWCFI